MIAAPQLTFSVYAAREEFAKTFLLDDVCCDQKYVHGRHATRGLAGSLCVIKHIFAVIAYRGSSVFSNEFLWGGNAITPHESLMFVCIIYCNQYITCLKDILLVWNLFRRRSSVETPLHTVSESK